MDIFRRSGLESSDFVRQTFVFTYCKPVLPAVRGSGFEDGVKFLYHPFAQFLFCSVNDEVYAAEVVGGLNDVVHSDAFSFDADGVGLEDVARLVVSQAAAFDVVGVICKVNLGAMIDASLDAHALLFAQCLEQG